MKDGLKLAALYAHGCRTATMYKINRTLSNFVKYGTNKKDTENSMKKLISYAWYKIIANQNNIDSKDVFSELVVRAHWTGNSLSKLIYKKEKSLFPFHNFAVLEWGHEKKNSLHYINQCKVSVGKVERLEHGTVLIKSYSIIRSVDGFSLSKSSEGIKIKKGFLDGVNKGDWITFHFGTGREIITKKQADFILKKTQESVKLFNKMQSKESHK